MMWNVGKSDSSIYHKYSNRQAWANNVDPDQTAPDGAVWSEFTLFVILPALLDTLPRIQMDLFKL